MHGTATNGKIEIVGPRTAFAQQLHAEKYRAPGETFEDYTKRVAHALADPEDVAELQFMLGRQSALPAGRVQAAVGGERRVTAHNCFVSGTIPDSFVDRDNPENSSIMHRAEQAATTMRMGGGIGYNFGTLRPRGATIEKLKSASSGPRSFMEIFDAVGRATSSAGNRRGAQMGVLPVHHPDVREFIRMKNNEDYLNGFNTSLWITDAFMEAVDRDAPFDLHFGGRVYDQVSALELWHEIMDSTHAWAEPGVLFGDTINRMNNLWYCEQITATNPCGEQPLPDFGACLLWSQNLVKYAIPISGGRWGFDYGWLASDIPRVVRALDRVIDISIYPLPEQEAEAKNKRRMGIGVAGLANMLEAMGHPYGSPGFLETEARILHLINREAYLEGTRLAEKYGPFPMYDAEKFCRGKFFATLDADVQDRIRRYGLRNSHYTSLAPTGTISLSADNISSGVESVIRWHQQRRVKMMGGEVITDDYDYGFREFGVRGKRSMFGEVTAKEHVAVLCAAQAQVDSAVSKTVNMDGSMPMEDFRQLYVDSYLGGAKGCTTFNSDGKRMGLFKPKPEPIDLPLPVSTQWTDPANGLHRYDDGAVGEFTALSCSFDPETGRKSCE